MPGTETLCRKGWGRGEGLRIILNKIKEVVCLKQTNLGTKVHTHYKITVSRGGGDVLPF